MAHMGLGLGWHRQAEVGGKGEEAIAQTQRGPIAKGARKLGRQLSWYGTYCVSTGPGSDSTAPTQMPSWHSSRL